MIIRTALSRGMTQTSWLESYHTFSFGGYYDPAHMAFGALRVLNDDVVAPSGGFAPHNHRDMEIITWVLSGALAHRDSSGGEGIIKPGEAQMMSAGTGITHSEYNASDKSPVHFLQLWVVPHTQNVKPRYEHIKLAEADLHNQWAYVFGPMGSDALIDLHADVHMHVARLSNGKALTLPPYARTWLHVAAGSVEIENTTLNAGDGAGLVLDEPSAMPSLTALVDAEFLVIQE